MNPFEPFSPEEEPDYAVSGDEKVPVMVGKKEMERLIDAGVLVPKEGGPWGATHWSSDPECWVMLMPKSRKVGG